MEGTCEPFDGTTFFRNFNAILDSQIVRGALQIGPIPKPAGFENIEIISEGKLPAMFPGVGSALLWTLLVKDGKVAEGMFFVSGTPDGSRHGSAFMATGVTAPKNEFQPSLEILLKAVGSVTLEQSYTDNGLRTLVENGQTLRAISKTLDETSGIITKGWEGRRKTGDIMAEQRSNKILGVERVQNPNTGEVYEVPNGYYEQHNLNRNSFTTGNLQQISDDAFELWTTPPLNGNRIY